MAAKINDLALRKHALIFSSAMSPFQSRKAEPELACQRGYAPPVAGKLR